MLFFKSKKLPIILSRDGHCISRKDIDPCALKILYRLSSLNYSAYLVGGSVRDLLLNRCPKDFDIGTSAKPNEIKRVFRNCFLVGKRFRLAHIVYDRHVFETATFRKQPKIPNDAKDQALYQTEDNTYGTPQEDAMRRDFTVNGLFYNIKDFSVIDYVGGLKDLKSKTIRCIGDPDIRFREDPVRMMRAMRFAAKLGFSINSADSKSIKKFVGELENASYSRLCEEIQRLFVLGATETSMRLSYDHGLIRVLIPNFAHFLATNKSACAEVWHTLSILDACDFENSLAVRFAVFYYPFFKNELAKISATPNRKMMHEVAEEILQPIVQRYRLPRAIWMTTVDLLEFLPRFRETPNPQSGRHVKFCTYGLFNESLEFASLIAEAYEDNSYKIKQWRDISAEIQEEHFRVEVENEEGEIESILRLPLNPHSRQVRRRLPRKRNAPRHPDSPKSENNATSNKS